MGKLANLRNGITKHIVTNIPGTDEKIALVQLNNKSIIEAREKAVGYIDKHKVDVNTADLIFNMFILEKAMREVDTLDICTNFEEINENLTPGEIYELHYQYLEVQNGASEDIEEMSEEEFEEIKKNLEKIQAKDLDGELHSILKYFHQTAISKALQKVK